MKTLILLLALGLSACGTQTQAPSINETPVFPNMPIKVPPHDVNVTYYTLTRISHPTIQSQPVGDITLTAYCSLFNDIMYCWDDGVQFLSGIVISGVSQQPIFQTYFGIGYAGRDNIYYCGFNCQVDPVPAPVIVGPKFRAIVGDEVIQEVFTNGTAQTKTCTQAEDIVDCGTFQIDLTQDPL